MHILVTGGTGLIGKAAIAALHRDGHELTVLTRRQRKGIDEARFVTALGDCMRPVDAVINLAGAGLADRRWSAAYKEEYSGAAAKPCDQRQRDWLLRS